MLGTPQPLDEDAAERDRLQPGLQGIGPGKYDVGEGKTDGDPGQGGQAVLVESGQGLVEGVGGIDPRTGQDIGPPGHLPGGRRAGDPLQGHRLGIGGQVEGERAVDHGVLPAPPGQLLPQPGGGEGGDRLLVGREDRHPGPGDSHYQAGDIAGVLDQVNHPAEVADGGKAGVGEDHRPAGGDRGGVKDRRQADRRSDGQGLEGPVDDRGRDIPLEDDVGPAGGDQFGGGRGGGRTVRRRNDMIGTDTDPQFVDRTLDRPAVPDQDDPVDDPVIAGRLHQL